MSQILINLLPVDIEAKNKQRSREKLVIRISIVILSLTVGLTAVVLFLILTQKISININEEHILKLKTDISNYRQPEGLAFVLKSRLDNINAIKSKETQHYQAFNLITALLPQDVRLISFSSNKGGILVISGETRSTKSLQTFFGNLTNQSTHENKITGTKIDNLVRAADATIKFDLTVTVSDAILKD